MMFILQYILPSVASTPPIIEMVTGISSTIVRVTWEQPDMPNGNITLYTITYSVDDVSSDVNVSYTGGVCNLCMLVCYVCNMCYCCRHNLMTLLDYLLINWSQ